MTSGEPTGPLALIHAILAREEIELQHCHACLAEAEAALIEPGLDDETLADWRSLPFVTIDNIDSRDLDQALLVEQDAEDYRLRYALADAAWYVRPGSALFDASVERGASFYTPLLTVPMLPRRLSEDLVSLNPEVPRRALVFDMRIAADGSVLGTSVVRAVIRSQAKLSYRGVQCFLDGQRSTLPGTPPADAPFLPSLRLLAELGTLLIRVAADRDVVPFNRRETEFDVAGEPPRFIARTRERLMVERYNEQLSLLCNQQGAALLEAFTDQSAELQPIYRVHDAPSPTSQRDLRKRLDRLADATALDDNWRWRQGTTLANYVASLPQAPEANRRRQAIERQILLTWTASEFRAEPGRHHALAVDSYARFSSPMREVAGIFTHKELLEALQQGDQSTGDDEPLRARVIAASNRARQTQKRIDKAIGFEVIASLLRADSGSPAPPAHPATLIGLRDDRLYLALDELALDLKLDLADLEAQQGCDYTLTEIAALASDPTRPSWHLGDALGVTVLRYDDARGRFIVGIVPMR